MYTWSDIALVLTSKGNPDKQQHSAVIVSPTGDTTPVDVPPWYGRNVSGTYTSESGRLVTATIDCDGERSEDNGACTTNAVLTVWVSDDARKWSILSQAELEGTMDKAYVGGELIEFSDDGDSATVLVTTYGEDKLIKQRPDGSVEIPIDENVETLCATPNGIVAQVADSASEQQTEMTTPRKGLADPVVENTGPLIRFDEAGEVVARSGNRLPSGRLLCGVSGRAYTDSGATMSISEIRTSDLSIGETMARYEEFGGHYVDVPGRGFVVVNEFRKGGHACPDHWFARHGCLDR